MRDAPAVSAPSCRHRLDERAGGATAVAAAELNVARDSPAMRARLRVRLRLAARGLAREPCSHGRSTASATFVRVGPPAGRATPGRTLTARRPGET
jgi:hypothetical protein